MSLPTNGGTDRDSFGSVSALAAHTIPSFSRPLSYSISRSQIVANGPTRKRTHSGDSLSFHSSGTSSRISLAVPRVSFASSSPLSGSPSSLSTTGGSAGIVETLPSLSCQLSAPPQAKRLRREPRSPTSVGKVSDAKKMLPAKTVVSTSPGAAQMQSTLRGLHHLSTCSASGCLNPLCVSTRAFVGKVKAHRSSMASQATHDANRCGACKLWRAIVRAHVPTCSAGTLCRVPGCSL